MPRRLRQLKTNKMKANKHNKGGRPAKADYKKRSVEITVRFTPVDKIYIKSCADECGLRVAEYIYRAAMRQETSQLLTEEEITAITKLRNIGNNLNQITHALHLGEVRETEIKEIISFITDIIRKVR